MQHLQFSPKFINLPWWKHICHMELFHGENLLYDYTFSGLLCQVVFFQEIWLPARKKYRVTRYVEFVFLLPVSTSFGL